MAPRITRPGGIKGRNAAVELIDWLDVGGVIEAVTE